MSMKVKITTINGAKMPSYQTKGAVGFDIRANETVIANPKSLVLIPTGLIIQVPEGYMLALCARSSTPKKGLLIPHGMGIIDQDYCGPQDQLYVQYYNYTDSQVTITKGERVAQGVFVSIKKASFSIDKPNDISRGGFGATGDD